MKLWKYEFNDMAIKQKLQEAAVAVEDLRRKLVEAQSVYDALYKQAISGAKPKKSAVESAAASGESNVVPLPNFTDRLDALLKSEPDKEWTNAELQSKLSDIPKTTLPSLLVRLRKTNKAVKIGYGKWKAA